MPRRSSPTRKLDDLRQKVAEAKAHEQEIAEAPGRLRREFDGLGDRLAEHDLPIDGSAPPAGSEAGKLWRKRHEIEVKLAGPWPQRRRNARAEIEGREAELARFVAASFGDLVAEIEPEAEAVARAVDDAAAGLLGALDSWHEVEGRVLSMVGYMPGLSGQDVPRLPADALRQELRRVRIEPSPRPLPRSLYGEEPDAEADEHRRRVEASVSDAES